jgi:glycosyltransferase involved in cell wall biosynthesis
MRPHPKKPLVSIIIPNFNHARFLKARLDSVLSQTFKNFELIILDDASTDNSIEVIRSILAAHPYKLYRNEVNSGRPCTQWLKGISQARGKYIWIAESDDTCSSTFLETMAFRLEQGVQLSYCRTNCIDAHGDSIVNTPFWPDTFDATLWRGSFSMDSKKLCKRFMPRGNIIANASCVVFRKPTERIIRQLQQLTDTKRYTGDWIFWSAYLMLMRGSVWFESKELSSFRSHGSTTRSIREPVSKSRESAEGQRFAEYSLAVLSILRVTYPWPSMRWFWIATHGGWDWIISEYLFRYHPSEQEKRYIKIMRGPLRLGIYARLVQSASVRRQYFAANAYCLS